MKSASGLLSVRFHHGLTKTLPHRVKRLEVAEALDENGIATTCVPAAYEMRDCRTLDLDRPTIHFEPRMGFVFERWGIWVKLKGKN